MIRRILRLTRWELFKLRRLRMPWIILAVLVMLNQIYFWVAYTTMYDSASADQYVVVSVPANAGEEESVIRVSCDDIEDGTVDSLLTDVPDEFREQARQEVESLRERCPEIRDQIETGRQRFANHCILPGSLDNGLKSVKDTVLVLVIILAASFFGREYTLGTFRPVMSRGVRRWEFLGAKALSIALTSGAGLLILSLVVVVSSLVAALLTGEDLVTADAGQWWSAAVVFGKVICILLPYIVVSLFFTVLTSSGTAPWGPALLTDYPGIESMARLKLAMGRHTIQYGDKAFYGEAIVYADSTLFEIFTYPLVKGNPRTALSAPYTAVVSESFAREHFGETDPIGLSMNRVIPSRTWKLNCPYS